MNDAIKKLIEDSNPLHDARKTLDNAGKLCNALEVAVEALERIKYGLHAPIAKNALQKIQAIVEGKTNE
jgi:hypothetical protein